jgi:hypothetical protein
MVASGPALSKRTFCRYCCRPTAGTLGRRHSSSVAWQEYRSSLGAAGSVVSERVVGVAGHLFPPVHSRGRLSPAACAPAGRGREVLRLLDLPEVCHLGIAPTWLLVQAATAVTIGAHRA